MADRHAADVPWGRAVWERVEVECYAGHTYPQEPRAWVCAGRRHQVARVASRWRTPAGPAFRVHDDSDAAWDLAYHEAAGRWSARPVDPTR